MARVAGLNTGTPLTNLRLHVSTTSTTNAFTDRAVVVEWFPVRAVAVPVKTCAHALQFDVEVFCDACNDILEGLAPLWLFSNQMTTLVPGNPFAAVGALPVAAPAKPAMHTRIDVTKACKVCPP